MRIPQTGEHSGAAEPEKGRGRARATELVETVELVLETGGPCHERERKLTKLEQRHLTAKADVTEAVSEGYEFAEALRHELIRQLPADEWAMEVASLCRHEQPMVKERGCRLWAEYTAGKPLTRTENKSMEVHYDAPLDPAMLTATPAAAEAMARTLAATPSGREALAAILGVEIPDAVAK